MARSRMVLDDGKQTGSRITVNINGSCGKMTKKVNKYRDKVLKKKLYLRIHLESLQGLPPPPRSL